jgi:hypothetical protein
MLPISKKYQKSFFNVLRIYIGIVVYEMNNEPNKDLIPCASYHKFSLIDLFSGGTKICQGDVHASE